MYLLLLIYYNILTNNHKQILNLIFNTVSYMNSRQIQRSILAILYIEISY